jgi:type IV pilus assembly protein PilZ
VEEKRVHPRIEIELDVKCEVADRSPIGGRTTDVSFGGMYVESGETLPFGTKLTIVAKLPEGELKLTGVVRWAKPGGFGVQFGLMGPRETRAIEQLLRRSGRLSKPGF